MPGAAQYQVEINPSQDFAIGSRVCCDELATGTSLVAAAAPAQQHVLLACARDRHGRQRRRTGILGPISARTSTPTLTPSIPRRRHARQRVRDREPAVGPLRPPHHRRPVVEWDPVPGASSYEVASPPGIHRARCDCNWGFDQAADRQALSHLQRPPRPGRRSRRAPRNAVELRSRICTAVSLDRLRGSGDGDGATASASVRAAIATQPQTARSSATGLQLGGLRRRRVHVTRPRADAMWRRTACRPRRTTRSPRSVGPSGARWPRCRCSPGIACPARAATTWSWHATRRSRRSSLTSPTPCRPGLRAPTATLRQLHTTGRDDELLLGRHPDGERRRHRAFDSSRRRTIRRASRSGRLPPSSSRPVAGQARSRTADVPLDSPSMTWGGPRARTNIASRSTTTQLRQPDRRCASPLDRRTRARARTRPTPSCTGGSGPMTSAGSAASRPDVVDTAKFRRRCLSRRCPRQPAWRRGDPGALMGAGRRRDLLRHARRAGRRHQARLHHALHRLHADGLLRNGGLALAGARELQVGVHSHRLEGGYSGLAPFTRRIATPTALRTKRAAAVPCSAWDPAAMPPIQGPDLYTDSFTRLIDNAVTENTN